MLTNTHTRMSHICIYLHVHVCAQIRKQYTRTHSRALRMHCTKQKYWFWTHTIAWTRCIFHFHCAFYLHWLGKRKNITHLHCWYCVCVCVEFAVGDIGWLWFSDNIARALVLRTEFGGLVCMRSIWRRPHCHRTFITVSALAGTTVRTCARSHLWWFAFTFAFEMNGSYVPRVVWYVARMESPRITRGVECWRRKCDAPFIIWLRRRASRIDAAQNCMHSNRNAAEMRCAI